MATKSFLNNIHFRNSKDAERLLSALENADNKYTKKVILRSGIEDVRGTRIESCLGKNKCKDTN